MRVKPLDLVSGNPYWDPYCPMMFTAWGPTHHEMFFCSLSPLCRDPESVWLPSVDTGVGSYGLPSVRLSSAAWAVFHLVVWSASLSFHPGRAGSTNFHPCHFPDVVSVFVCPWSLFGYKINLGSREGLMPHFDTALKQLQVTNLLGQHSQF